MTIDLKYKSGIIKNRKIIYMHGQHLTRTFLIIIYLVVSVIQSTAQTQEMASSGSQDKVSTGGYKRLFVGDRLPFNEYLFSETRNYKGKRLKWSDLRDKKLIILDFWSKSCSACIGAFPKMQKLQEQFGTDIRVILITPDSEKELARLFEKSENVKNTPLPIVMNDTAFSKTLFPHNTVPYHVWLTGDGKVVATVNSHETTAENIQRFLSDKEVQMSMRADNVSDFCPKDLDQPSGSFLTVESGRLADRIIYYAQIQSPRIINQVKENVKIRYVGHSFFPKLGQYSVFLSGMPEYNPFKFNGYLKDSLGNIKGLKLFNYSMRMLLRLAYKDSFAGGESIFRLRFLPEGNARDLYEEMTDSTNKNRFTANNMYCYESSINEYTEEKSLSILREDIARCFGLRVKLEEKVVQCAIVKVIDSTKLNNMWSRADVSQGDKVDFGEVVRSDGSTKYKNVGFGYFITDLINANVNSSFPFVVDSTGIPQEKLVNYTLNIASHKLTEQNGKIICKEIEKYGMSIEIVPRKEKVLVLYSAF